MAKGGQVQIAELLRDYWVGDLLGTGARSQIYAVKRRSDGYDFAVKFVQVRTAQDRRIVDHLENEFQVLQAVHNPKRQPSEFIIFPVEFRKVKSMLKLQAAYLVMERAGVSNALRLAGARPGDTIFVGSEEFEFE